MAKKAFIAGQDCNRSPGHLRKRCPIHTEITKSSKSIGSRSLLNPTTLFKFLEIPFPKCNKPLSKKVIDGLQKAKNRKILNFSEIKEANAYAQDLDKTVVSKDNLSSMTLSMQFIFMHRTRFLSLLSNCTGIKKESFGTVILDLLKHLKSDPGLIKIVECMQNSRMGIFIHNGQSDRYVILEELVTGKEIKAIVPSGYHGKRNEIWYARVMPEPFPDIPLSLPHSEASQRERGEI